LQALSGDERTQLGCPSEVQRDFSGVESSHTEPPLLEFDLPMERFGGTHAPFSCPTWKWRAAARDRP
jgi:hypothetical protein